MSETQIPVVGQVNPSNGQPAKRVTLAIIGCGFRGTVYASYALKHPELAQVVAIADPRQHRRKVLSQSHNLGPEAVFTDWKELHAKGRIADAIAICVLDQMHAELVEAFAAQGYHILCEKPMATSVEECVKMIKDVESVDDARVFGIGHVLRYSPYNVAIKKVIDSGAIGDIVNIQHIEPVGNAHFAHSYVRGNWHRSKETSFGLMTKCCHDIDILSFYLSGVKPVSVSSFGSLHHFRKDQKPAKAGNAKRCLECPFESECVWSAKKIYVEPLKDDTQPIKWASLFVDADVLDIENVSDALRTGPYGKCVYENDNDIVDNQVVNIQYANGATASLTMLAFTEALCQRSTRIAGTKGEIIGDMSSFTVFDFLTRSKTVHNIAPGDPMDAHGGGDLGLSEAFVSAVASGDQSVLGVTPDDVLNSHLIVFAAEEARLQNQVINFEEYKRTAVKTGAKKVVNGHANGHAE